MATIRWSLGARRDLHEIINYIAEDSPSYAVNFAERIILAIDRLKTFPQARPRCARVPRSGRT
jgi:plasmid stabilization system protein ParE